MLEIRRILCPVDFSEASRHALDHAVVLAGWYGSRLTGLHVAHSSLLLEPPVLFADFQGTEPLAPAEVAEVAGGPGGPGGEDARARLVEWFAPARAAGLETDLWVDEHRHPADRIVARAASWPADLVVMGTHGRSGFKRLLLGSVTEDVLRRTATPVLVVPPPVVRPAKPPFTRVLCPVDFSESSLAALRFALSLAKESGAQLTLMHTLMRPADDDVFVDRFDTPEFCQQLEGETRRRLETLVPKDARPWCEPSVRVVWGMPERAILDEAARDDADLIVVGVHGRSALDLVVFGSTTNHVVREATCPVLTLRS